MATKKKWFTKKHKNDTGLSKEYWKIKQKKRNTQNKVASIKEMPRL